MKISNCPGIVLAMLLLVSIAAFSCKKSADNKFNISLHDKSLDVIQSYIQGSWKLHHEMGGICGSCIYYPKDSTSYLYASLTPQRILFRNTARLTLDTTIVWTHVNIFGDSTFIMKFFDKNGAPIILGAREVVNDTLVLYQPGPDGQYFYYTKTN